MIKWVFVTLFFIVGLPIFSEETCSECHCPLQEWEYQSLFHSGLGNARLLLREPEQALEHFQKAYAFLDKSDDSFNPAEFFILFGQIIAYDCLGLHDQCRQAIGTLFLRITEDDDEEDSPSGKDDDDQMTDEVSKLFLDTLKTLANMAPSPDVRGLLLSMIEDIGEEFLPTMGAS